MTQTGAERLCTLARAMYGDQVETKIDERRVRGKAGYSVVLQHKTLGRSVSVSDVKEWQGIKDAWAAALGFATCEACGKQFKLEEGYFEIDDRENGVIGYSYCADCCTW